MERDAGAAIRERDWIGLAAGSLIRGGLVVPCVLGYRHATKRVRSALLLLTLDLLGSEIALTQDLGRADLLRFLGELLHLSRPALGGGWSDRVRLRRSGSLEAQIGEGGDHEPSEADGPHSGEC